MAGLRTGLPGLPGKPVFFKLQGSDAGQRRRQSVVLKPEHPCCSFALGLALVRQGADHAAALLLQTPQCLAAGIDAAQVRPGVPRLPMKPWCLVRSAHPRKSLPAHGLPQLLCPSQQSPSGIDATGYKALFVGIAPATGADIGASKVDDGIYRPIDVGQIAHRFDSIAKFGVDFGQIAPPYRHLMALL